MGLWHTLGLPLADWRAVSQRVAETERSRWSLPCSGGEMLWIANRRRRIRNAQRKVLLVRRWVLIQGLTPPGVSRWPRHVWCWSRTFRSWGWVAERAHSSSTGGVSLSHDTVWGKVINIQENLQFDSNLCGGKLFDFISWATTWARFGTGSSLSRRSRNSHSSFSSSRSNLGPYSTRNSSCHTEERMKFIVLTVIPKSNESKRNRFKNPRQHSRKKVLTLKNSSLSAGSDSSAWTNEWKFSTVFWIFKSFF